MMDDQEISCRADRWGFGLCAQDGGRRAAGRQYPVGLTAARSCWRPGGGQGRGAVEPPAKETSRRDDSLHALTPREREVFFLASRGLKNAEIAAELFLSEKTIKTHLRNIYNKLDLASKAELRLFAVKWDCPTESRGPERPEARWYHAVSHRLRKFTS